MGLRDILGLIYVVNCALIVTWTGAQGVKDDAEFAVRLLCGWSTRKRNME